MGAPGKGGAGRGKEGGGGGAGNGGAGAPALPPHPPLHGGSGVGDGHEFPMFSLLCVSFMRFTLFAKDRPGQGAIGMLAQRRPARSAVG